MYGKKSTHLHIIPAAKNPKHNKFDFFLLYGMGVDLSSRDNFANLGSFAKVQVSKALKAQLIDLYKHSIKPVISLVVKNRDATFAPTKT